MRQIFIDVTELTNWTGHLTGIQRVVYNTAQSLAAQKTHSLDVRFVYFNSATGSFTELEFLPEHHSFKGEESKLSEGASHLKIAARDMYVRLPYGLRSKITAQHKQAAKKIYHFGKNAYKGIRQKLQSQSKMTVDGKTPQAIAMGRSDVIISSGRIWDDPQHQAALIQLKQSYGVKLGYVIYDLIPIYQQHTFGPGLTVPYTNYLYDVLSHADLVFPISKSSERDLMRFASELGFVSTPKSQVIRLGDDLPSKSMNDYTQLFGDNFCICVGTFEARKNHQILYNVYKLAKEKSIDLPRLYIIGGKGWLTDDLRYFIENDSDIKDKIKLTTDIDDEKLSWLYRNAKFSVYPSQYEGWGLPVAESLAYGLPCVASNSSSIVEIASGDVVNFISPFDSNDILQTMQQLANSANNKKQRTLIKTNYKVTTWKSTASAVLKGLNSTEQ